MCLLPCLVSIIKRAHLFNLKCIYYYVYHGILQDVFHSLYESCTAIAVYIYTFNEHAYSYTCIH